MKCPKCGTEERDVARFCKHCHMTLRYECPACHHEQRQGGVCEKCGVDFLKYITSVIAVQKGQADAEHDRIEQRSNLMKNILLMPFTMGIPLIRQLIDVSRKGRR
jgi:hypothetical protein